MWGHFLKAGFYLDDVLRGGLVTRHIRHMDELHLRSDGVDEHRVDRLRDILAHAAASTNYYRDYKGTAVLADFPVVSQATLRFRVEDFTTSKKDLLQTAVSDTTSGSYGMPLIFLFDREKYARRRAEVIHFNALAGFELGMRYARIHTSLKALERTSPAVRRRQNLVDIFMPGLEEKYLHEACDRLAVGDVDVLLGWPSMLSALSLHAQQRGVKLRGIKTVISYGEVLSANSRALIEQVMGTPVFDRYACTEIGVIAHDLPGGTPLYINRASYVVEVLNPYEDKPAEPGTRGRIVITDLYSKAIPLIRYDTGDTAVLSPLDGKTQMHLANIEGRYNETIYDTAGNPILSLRLYSALSWSEKKKIKQFQIAQVGEITYELLIMPRDEVDASTLELSMKTVVGSDAEVRVRFVDRIDPLPSGKRPVIVNRIDKKKEPSA